MVRERQDRGRHRDDGHHVLRSPRHRRRHRRALPADLQDTSSKNRRRCCCKSPRTASISGDPYDAVLRCHRDRLGPGGYVCAIRAAQLGLKAAIVERDELGGICLNWGCIPTKALLRSSEIWHLMHRLEEFGFSADNLKFDLAKIVARSRAVSKQLSNGVAFLMKKHKITVIAGEAKLAGKGKVAVTKDGKTTDYTAKNIVLATGARARALPGLEPDGKLVWTYREAMVPHGVSQDRCWWSARAPSASNSPASSARWARRSRWSKCSTACCRWKTRRFPRSPPRPSTSRA